MICFLKAVGPATNFAIRPRARQGNSGRSEHRGIDHQQQNRVLHERPKDTAELHGHFRRISEIQMM
ncbi:MAG: hypothetical protein ACRD3S_05170, partial [Terracidiphilus sp.]